MMRMETRCLLLLWLFFFLKSNTKAETSEKVTLRCDPREADVEPRQELILHCWLNSSEHHGLCAAKAGHLECGAWRCELETAPHDNQEGARTRRETVKIYNVTSEGMLTVSMETSCGVQATDSVKIVIVSRPGAVTGPESSKVTGPESSKVTGPESSKVTGPESSKVTGPESSKASMARVVLRVVCVALLPLLTVLVLCIRKYRRERRGEHQEPPQHGTGVCQQSDELEQGSGTFFIH